MPAVDAVFRPEFRDALGLLGKAMENMRLRGLTSPILVGGAAVEFYTGGAVTTGDFDFVTPLQDEFFQELENVGFRRPERSRPRRRNQSAQRHGENDPDRGVDRGPNCTGSRRTQDQ